MTTFVPPGVSEQIAEERGYVRIMSQQQLIGYNHRLTERQQQQIPGLLLPVYKLGEFYTYVLRPDRPRMGDTGKDLKYEWPAGVGMCLDVLPRFRDALGDVTKELWLTEGAKKADALATADERDERIVPINIHGVWCWKKDDRPLPDFDAITWKGRQVVLAFDSDVTRKDSVQKALRALAKQLKGRGATVRVLVLPDAADKLGVDDALADGMTMDDLRAHVRALTDLPKPARMDAEDAAVQLAADHGDHLAYDADLDSFRAYRGHAWQMISDTDLMLHGWIVDAETACGLQRTNNMKANVLTHAKRHLVRTFVAQPGLISFSNGTLDVATGTLRTHTSADNLTFCLPYDWMPEQPTPTIDAALAQTIPDEIARHAFRTHAGLALLGNTTFQHALLLLGQPNTGKTTILQIFNRLLGQPGMTFAPGEIFRAEREGSLQRAECRNWRGVALDEFPADVLKDEEPFKKMTAHSGIDSRQHHQKPINTQWLPKIVLTANDVPRFRDPSGALARRLLVVECPHAIDLAALDLQIDARLDAELPGFAAQCLAAAQAAITAHGYPISAGMRAAFEAVATEGDALKSFVAERCLLTVHTHQAHEVVSSDLYKDYKDWCEENGNHALSHSALSRRLHDYAPWKITKQRTMRGITLIGITVRGSYVGSDPQHVGYSDILHNLPAHQEAVNARWHVGYVGYVGKLSKSPIQEDTAVQAVPTPDNVKVETFKKHPTSYISYIEPADDPTAAPTVAPACSPPIRMIRSPRPVTLAVPPVINPPSAFYARIVENAIAAGEYDRARGIIADYPQYDWHLQEENLLRTQRLAREQPTEATPEPVGV